MSLPPDHPLSARRRAPPFRPSFTLALLYVAAFAVLYAFLFILPDLIPVLRDVPPGPAQEQIAREVAQKAFAPGYAYIPLVLALVTVAVGARFEFLPGLRSPKA